MAYRWTPVLQRIWNIGEGGNRRQATLMPVSYRRTRGPHAVLDKRLSATCVCLCMPPCPSQSQATYTHSHVHREAQQLCTLELYILGVPLNVGTYRTILPSYSSLEAIHFYTVFNSTCCIFFLLWNLTVKTSVLNWRYTEVQYAPQKSKGQHFMAPYNSEVIWSHNTFICMKPN